MENFFYNDNFYSDIDGVIDELEYNMGTSVNEFPEDFEIEVELAQEEPIFQLDMQFVVKAIEAHTERYEDRFPEDSTRVDAEIKKAIEGAVDLAKLNKSLPKLYYTTGKYAKITKADLLD